MFNLRRKRRKNKKYNIVDYSKPLNIEKTKIIPMSAYALFDRKKIENHKTIFFWAIAIAIFVSAVCTLNAQSNSISIDDQEGNIPPLKRCDKRIIPSNSSQNKLPDWILSSIESPIQLKRKK
jgi:hypothetical protein